MALPGHLAKYSGLLDLIVESMVRDAIAAAETPLPVRPVNNDPAPTRESRPALPKVVRP